MTKNKKLSQQEMIEEIYKKIADKTLSFGCKIDLGIAEGVVYRTTQGGGIVDFFIGIQLQSAFTKELIKNSQIIGHPVMIGNVLNYINNIEDNEEYERIALDILYNWEKETKPIEEQDDNCIKFVYDLIK